MARIRAKIKRSLLKSLDREMKYQLKKTGHVNVALKKAHLAIEGRRKKSGRHKRR